MLAVASPPDQILPTSQEAVLIDVGHFADGERADLVSVARNGVIDVALNRGNNQWDSLVSTQVTGEQVLAASKALLNSDSLDDLVLRTESQVLLLSSDGLGGWQTLSSVPVGGVHLADAHPAVDLAVAYLSGDYLLDLAVPLPQVNEVAVLRGDAAGVGPPVFYPSGGVQPLAVRGGSFIGSEETDLVVGHADGSLAFLEGEQLGFNLRPDLTLNAGVGAIVAMEVADLDGDGLDEVIVAGQSGVTVLTQESDPLPNSPIANASFLAGVSEWEVSVQGHPLAGQPGRLLASSGLVQFIENDSFLTSLSQTFAVPPTPQLIEVDLVDIGLATPELNTIPDAFEVSLLDSNGSSLVAVHHVDSTAFASFQADGSVSLSASAGIVGETITLDISGLTPGTDATLRFDLIGHPQANSVDQNSTVTLDEVRITPSVIRNDSVSQRSLPGGYSEISDMSIADIDGDGFSDLLIADVGQNQVVILHGDASGDFSLSEYSTLAWGAPSVLAAGPMTASDAIADLAIGLAGQSQILTPLLFDKTVPTVELASPGPQLTIGASDSALGTLGTITLEFSEEMYAPSPSASGSASNPASYQVYNFGPNGVDEAGEGDDIVFAIQDAVYDASLSTVALSLDATRLDDPAMAAGSRYAVVALGADDAVGLRDLADNFLDGGQDAKSIIRLIREPTLSGLADVGASEGDLVTLSAEVTHYTFDASFTARIDWGDGHSSTLTGSGSFPAEGFLDTHTYSDDGSYTVSFSVEDQLGQVVAEQLLTAEVANVAPVLTPRSAVTATEGVEQVFQLLDFTDPGYSDGISGTSESFTAIIDWGDGSAAETVTVDIQNGTSGVPTSGTVVASHTYLNDGSFAPTVVLADDDGGSSSLVTPLVTVENIVPSILALQPIVSDEGELAILEFVAVDAGGDVLSGEVDWGDSTSSPVDLVWDGSAWLGRAEHYFADNGSYVVSVVLSDGTDTIAQATVANVSSVAPTVVARNRVVEVGAELVLEQVTFSDPGFDRGSRVESFAAAIDWGDGSPVETVDVVGLVPGAPGVSTTGVVAASHTFATPGTYHSTVSVTDDDGETGSATFTIAVNEVSSGAGKWLPIIDFERDALGNLLHSGDQIAEQWSAWGVHVETHSPINHPAMIFDSSKPTGGDSDLGTPNESFGGPGIGSGGQLGASGENREALQNVLIISEDGDSADPDDRAAGGVIEFRFDEPVMLDDLRFLDISQGESIMLRSYDAHGTILEVRSVPGQGGPNGVLEVPLNARSLGRLEIEFSGSGALSDVIFCRSLTPGSSVQAIGPLSIREGDVYELELQRNGLLIDNWLVNWGDGTIESYDSSVSTLTHIFADGPKSRTIFTTAQAEQGVYVAQELEVSVANVIPTLTIRGEAKVQEGQTYYLGLESQDPGADRIRSWLIDWGDGTPFELIAGNPDNATHVYERAGDFEILAHARDEDYDGPSYLGATLIEVRARGSEGGENLELLIDDQVVSRFIVSQAWKKFRYAAQQPVAPNQVKIRFTNDEYDPANDIDANLQVDFLSLNGKRYQTEASDVYSTGTWKSEDGIQAGYRESEWLHANGYFQFDHDGDGGSRIKIRAKGSEGGEVLDLVIAGHAVARFEARQDFQTFAYKHDRVVFAEDIEVHFVNDFYDPSSGVDRNLRVNFIRVDGQRFETEAPEVFSTGTWTPTQGIVAGYHESEWLHANGYFRYASNELTSNPFRSDWVSNTLPVSVTPDPNAWLPIIDFEYSSSGIRLSKGESIADQFGSLGVTISSDDPQQIPRVFDSSRPGDDEADLGAPNGAFGGPGVGQGGRSGPGVNSLPLGNILILTSGSDDDRDHDEDEHWDDNDHDDHDGESSSRAVGGTLVFDFDQPVMMDEVTLLNIDEPGSEIRLYDAAGSLVDAVPVLDLGSNSYQVVTLAATGVRRMEISLPNGGAVASIVSCRESLPIQPAPTRFFVVDSDDTTYRYSASGSQAGEFSTASRVNARGAATTGEGNPIWIVSEEGYDEYVYVYDTDGTAELGAWKAKGLTDPQGIATDGADIWIVDDGTNKVYRYADAAARRSGYQFQSDYFQLAYGNSRPSGITTDGTYLWVVDRCNKVFVYELDGDFVNWWELDEANSAPTGVTIATDGSEGLWVVDAYDDRVYEYGQRTLPHLGSQSAVASFELAPGNDHPQGIADPVQTISIGDTVSESLLGGDTFDWSFNANAGQEIYTVFTSLTGTQFFDQVTTTLFSPSGQVVYAKSDYRYFIHTSGPHVLGETGTYTLQMTSTADVTFSFQLLDVPAPDVTEDIQFGQSYAGQIETPGVRDHFTFAGTAGAQVFFDAQSLNGDTFGGAVVSFVDPSGTTISSVSASRVFSLDHTVDITETGTYTIVVSGVGADTPGYSFQIIEIPPPDVLSIQYGETANGNIEVPGAVDQWVLEASAGDNVFIDFTALVGGELSYTVETPSGSILYTGGGLSAAVNDVELVLPETGSYTITVQVAFGQASTPTYSFVVYDIPPLLPQPAVLNASFTGTLVPGEHQEFVLEIEANTEVLLDVIETNQDTLGIQLLAPDGSFVTSRTQDDALLTLEQAGEYRAIVQRIDDSPLGNDARGDFEFRLQDVTYRAGGQRDSLGTRFYLGYQRNLLPLFGGSPNLSVAITSPSNTSGAILIPGLNYFQSFDVSAGQSQVVDLSFINTILQNDQTADIGVIVASVDEVAVYGLNQFEQTTDGFTALPLDAIGTEYRIMAYPNTVQLTGDGGSSLAVVGTQDNTLVTIVPAVDAGPHPAGVPFTIELDEAQVYQLYASAANANGGANLFDLTGSTITATAPVSVYGGNTAAYVPAGFGAADHLVEQMPAIDSWGKRFLSMPLATRTGGDTLRILASQDGTSLEIDGAQVATLDAGEVYEQVLVAPALIETSQPALVAQFAHGSTFDGSTGDPFMSLVPPVEQFQLAYTMTTPVAGIDSNFVNLIVPQSSITSVQVDGSTLEATAFQPIGSSGYSAASFPIGVGSHNFSSPEPIAVTVYGFDAFDSYGYFGGMSLAPVADVASLTLTTDQNAVPLNSQTTVTTTVLDDASQGLAGIRVDFAISGANPGSDFAFTDENGNASIQYTGIVSGTDAISASAVGLTANGTIDWSASPPTIQVREPSSGAELPVGTYVLSGVGSATLPGAYIVEARVDGRPVDVLDASGNFFIALEVQSGLQSVGVEVVDSFGQIARQSVEIVGISAGVGPADPQATQDVTASASLRYTGATFNHQSKSFSVDSRLVASSQLVLDPTIAARLDDTNASAIALNAPEAFSDAGLPLVLFDTELPQGGLLMGGESAATRLSFENPQTERFSPEFTMLAATNLPPVFQSVPMLQSTPGSAYVYAAEAFDPNGHAIAFSLVSASEGMSIDEQTGEVTWLPGASDVGTHAVVIEATDGRGGAAQQGFTITIEETLANRPPVIFSPPVASLATGDDYFYQVLADDPDDDALEFSLVNAPGEMTIDAFTGLIAAPNLADGNYPVSIQVSDRAGGLALQDFTLSVGGVGITAPTVTSTPVVSAVVGSLYVYSPTALDSSQTALNYSLLSSPPGMQIDAASGRITWRPTLADFGTTRVQVQVANQLGATALQSYSLTTRAARPNVPPVFATDALRVATVDVPYQYAVQAIDEPAQSLTYELLVAPTAMTMDPVSGLISWTPTQTDVDAGPFRVLIAASDSLGAMAYQQYFLEVRDVNEAPVFSSEPVVEIQAGDLYRYNAFAADNDDEVRYSLSSAPTTSGGMQIDAVSGSVTWQPGLAQIGSHSVAILATDDRGASVEQSFTLNVTEDLESPTIDIVLSSDQVAVGETVTISVQASDNVGVEALSLFQGTTPITLVNGLATLSFSQAGYIYLTASAVDASGNRADDSSVLKVGTLVDNVAPTVAIHSPSDNATITYLTDVVATVADANLKSYTLEYSRLNDGNWRPLQDVRVSDGTPIDVDQEVIASFDPTLLKNDEYQLRLTAEDLSGNRSFAFATLSLDGQAKLGNFRIGFTDLSVPLAGIPIQIQRVYDTLEAEESLDFGFGWKLDVASPQLRETIRVTESEAAGAGTFASNPFRVGTRVYMSVPSLEEADCLSCQASSDGSTGSRRVGFTFDPIPEPGLLGTIWRPRFVPDPGVYHQLEVDDVALSQASDGTFGLYLTGFAYNPASYTLITKDQMRYRIDQFSSTQTQLNSIIDRNGVRLEFREDGIFSSTGQSITWTRDSSGRITEILDPDGNKLTYSYDANGDLRQYSDQIQNTWSMDYSAAQSHFLDTVLGPRGNLIHQVQYDDHGRYIGLTDALGNETSQSYDLDNNSFFQTDALGYQSRFTYDDLGNVLEVEDASGRISSASYGDPANPYLETLVTDARGVPIEFSYDSAGNLTLLRESTRSTTIHYNVKNDILRIDGPIPSAPPSGFEANSVSLGYDANGNLISFTNASGNSETFQYDSLGRMTSQIDAGGSLLEMEYGNFGDPELIRFADGSERTVQRDNLGRIETSTNELGYEVRFTYDEVGRPLTIQDALGRIYENQYQDDLLVRTIDPLGRTTEFQYDAKNRLTSIIDPAAGVISRTYDANDRVTTVANQRGQVDSWSYSPTGEVLSYSDNAGRTTYYTYDALANLSSVLDARGFETLFVYDDLNHLTSVVDARGNAEHYAYDERDNLISVTGRNGGVSTFAYDAVGNLLATTNAIGDTQSWTYDQLGNNLSYTDQRGNVTQYSYDDRNRLIAQTDASGFEQQWQYDVAGRLLQLIDQEANAWTYSYDANNQLIGITDSLGSTRSFSYDEVGNLTVSSDELGRSRTRNYDLLDRVISEMDAKGELTLFDYDELGNLLSVKDPLNNETSYEYDEVSQLVSKIDPLGNATRYEYDELGNLLRSVDRLGRITEYNYDELNRLVGETWKAGDGSPLQTFSFAYDPSGNMTQAIGPDSAYSFSYDLLDRVTRVSNFGSPNLPQLSLNYSYDATGNLNRVVDNSDVSISYSFDARNLVSSATWSGGGVDAARVEYDYDGRGLTTEIFRFNDATGIAQVSSTQNAYDQLGRITGIAHQSPTNEIIADYQFSYDLASQLIQQVINGETSSYVFDTTGQLTDVVNSSRPDEAYQYDANGNRIDSDNVVGPNNQLLSDGSFDYQYDAEGNLVSKIDLTTGEYTEYVFDHRNRLVAASKYSSGGILLAASEYTYDVFNRLISRSVDADGSGPSSVEKTHTLYNGQNAWVDYDSTGTVTTRYFFSQGVDSNIARWRPGEGTAWYLADHLGSIRDIIDANGVVIDHVDYDSFGNILAETNPGAGDRYKFTGREWTPELSLYYYRARFYDPATGIFISQDPIGFASGDSNLQRYVGNSPLTFSDPYGLSAVASYGGSLRGDLAAAGAQVGGIGGFVCGFLDGWYESGTLGGGLQRGVQDAAIGAALGAAVAYTGASPNVAVRFFTYAVGSIGAATYLATSQDLGQLAIRTACFVATAKFGSGRIQRTINRQRVVPPASQDFAPTRLSWNEFRSQIGGRGYTRKQVSRLYRKYLKSKGIELTAQSKRVQYLGATPGKNSATGRQVLDRMRSEGRVLDTPAGTFVQDADGAWYPLEEMDMGHVPLDAVKFWNTFGVKDGPKSAIVREWMLDPNNYELQHFSKNRSLGASLGETYIDPY